MEKEEIIIQAGIKLFQEKGFAATTVSAVAKEAGIGKGTVYGYFKSKEELLLKACLYNCEKDSAELEALVNAPEFSNPVKKIHAMLIMLMSKFLAKSADEHKLFYELSVLAADNPEVKQQAKEALQEKLQQWRGMAEADYLAGVESGHFRSYETPAYVGEFFVAMVNGLIWELQWNDEEFLKGQAQRIVSVYCQMLLKEPARLEEYLK